jgi:hypothetical protein
MNEEMQQKGASMDQREDDGNEEKHAPRKTRGEIYMLTTFPPRGFPGSPSLRIGRRASPGIVFDDGG